jgi:hypothetical protein
MDEHSAASRNKKERACLEITNYKQIILEKKFPKVYNAKQEETMKLKKFRKKLNLNKKTIADLKNVELVKIQAGGPSGLTCPNCAVTTYSRCLTVCGGPYC